MPSRLLSGCVNDDKVKQLCGTPHRRTLLPERFIGRTVISLRPRGGERRILEESSGLDKLMRLNRRSEELLGDIVE